MNILIIGGGKVGLTLAQNLRNENHNIAVIDPNPDVLEALSAELDVLGIEGSGACREDLLKAGAADADLAIATTSQDEVNILSCVIAKRLGVGRAIARVRDPKLSSQLAFLRDELGISFVINPEAYAAGEIARIIRMPAAIKVESFAKGRIDLAEIKVKADSPLHGLSLFRLPSVIKEKILICAILRGENVIIPSGDFTLQAEDRIYVTASHADLAAFAKSQDGNQRIRHVMIIGGSRIAYYLTRLLLESGIAVTIIERNEARCEVLSNAFPKATIICDDGTSQSALLREGLADTDACVTLTGLDEQNILISLFAKNLGCTKVITKVNKPSLGRMVSDVGLDSLVSPKLLTTNMIVQYVRAVQNSEGSHISTLYKLLDERVEAIEFLAHTGSRLIGVPLKDLKLKKDLLIAGIIRGNKVIIPRGGDTVTDGDSVIVVTTHQYFRDLDDVIDS